MRNTKGIAAIILAVIMACSVMTMIVPMAMGDDPTASTKASVNNAAPDVEIASIQPDPAYPPCSITVSGTLSDPNGLDDLRSFFTMEYTIKRPDGSMYCTGWINDNDGSWSFSCYLFSWVPHGVWTVEVTATDKEGLSDTDSMTFTVGEVTGIEIDFSTVNFGAINVSETRTVEGDYDNTTADAPTIRNTGNTNITAVLISATDMWGSDTIGNENIGAKVNETSWQNLDAQRTFTVTIPPANTAKIDYNLTVPTGTLPGSYSGTTSITADFEE